MSKLVDDSALDALLDEIATSTALRVCSGNPTSRAEAVTNTLATVAINGADFTKANGDTSGRKTTVAQQSDISITASGTAATICLDDGTTLLAKTDLSSTQAITSGGTVTTNAFDIEVADAA